MPEDNLQTASGSSVGATGQPTPPKLWMGKYRSAEEMESSVMNHMVPEIQRLGSENKTLNERIDAIMPLLEREAAGGRGGQSPPTANAVSALAEKLNVDERDLYAAIDARAEARLQQALAPLSRGLAARQTIAREIPDFGQNEPKIYQFLNENAAVNKRYNELLQANPEAAMDYADAAWRRAAGTSAPRESASGAEQVQARLDATLQGGSGSGPGNANATDDMVTEYNTLRDNFMKSRSPQNRDALVNFLAKLQGR